MPNIENKKKCIKLGALGGGGGSARSGPPQSYTVSKSKRYIIPKSNYT